MTDIEMQICDRFKEIRKSLDMKQGEFANSIQTTQGHVSDIENKRKNVSDRIMEIICLKYSINKNWFKTGEGEMKKPTSDKLSAYLGDIAIGDDDLIVEIIESYMELDSNAKQAIREFIDKLAEKRMKH